MRKTSDIFEGENSSLRKTFEEATRGEMKPSKHKGGCCEKCVVRQELLPKISCRYCPCHKEEKTTTEGLRELISKLGADEREAKFLSKLIINTELSETLSDIRSLLLSERQALVEKALDEIRNTANKYSGPTEPDCTIYNELRALEERLPDLLKS